MAPSTMRNLEFIVQDLKSSNYFRVWAFFWITAFIIFFVGFGIYVNHVDSSSSIYATGFQPYFSLQFPLYHFRLEGLSSGPMAINVDSVTCLWNNTVPLAIDQCQGYPPFTAQMANCFVVMTHNSTFTAWATMDGSGLEKPLFQLPTPDLYFSPNRNTSRISCNFTVNPTVLGSTANWIAWELEGLTDYNYGDNAYSSVWFPNYSQEWIMLEQFQINNVVYWDRYRMSHLPATPPTDALNNTLYQTTTIMDTNTVQYYQQFSFGYHSWNGLADIGGLAFALYIMKTVAMLLVGLVLDNDSIFLGGRESGKDTERAPIVSS